MTLNARAIKRRNKRQKQSKSLRHCLLTILMRKRLTAMKQDKVMGSFITSVLLEKALKLADYQKIYEQLIAHSDLGKIMVRQPEDIGDGSN